MLQDPPLPRLAGNSGLGDMPAPSTIEELGLATIGKEKSTPAHEVGAKQAGTTVGRKETTKEATQEEPTSAEPNLEEAKSQESSPPFIIREGLPAVLAKLVSKIQRGEYVDMAELLHERGGATPRHLKVRQVMLSSEQAPSTGKCLTSLVGCSASALMHVSWVPSSPISPRSCGCTKRSS